MRKGLVSLFMVFIIFSLAINLAEAKRFGGGKSFGYSRSFSHSNSASSARRFEPQAKSTASRFLAPLAGFALGGLLASLFMGHGLGTGMLSWILLLGGLFLGWQLINKFRQSASFQRAPIRPSGSTYADSAYHPNLSTNHYQQTHNASSFDQAGFLREAKTTFIRLQAAYDSKNLADIREFTTPQVYAEIQMQLQERGSAINQTEVIAIDADLLDYNADELTMSVLFTGSLREEPTAAPSPIKETWHFSKVTDHANWLVTGIQQ